MIPPTPPPLTAEEMAAMAVELREHEAAISPAVLHVSDGGAVPARAVFIETVLGVYAIATGKLYRVSAPNLETYFRERFGMSRAQVYRLLDCANLYKDFAARYAGADPAALHPFPLKQRLCKTIRTLADPKPLRQALWARTLRDWVHTPDHPIHVDELTSKHVRDTWSLLARDADHILAQYGAEIGTLTPAEMAQMARSCDAGEPPAVTGPSTSGPRPTRPPSAAAALPRSARHVRKRRVNAHGASAATRYSDDDDEDEEDGDAGASDFDADDGAAPEDPSSSAEASNDEAMGDADHGSERHSDSANTRSATRRSGRAQVQKPPRSLAHSASTALRKRTRASRVTGGSHPNESPLAAASEGGSRPPTPPSQQGNVESDSTLGGEPPHDLIVATVQGLRELARRGFVLQPFYEGQWLPAVHRWRFLTVPMLDPAAAGAQPPPAFAAAPPTPPHNHHHPHIHSSHQYPSSYPTEVQPVYPMESVSMQPLQSDHHQHHQQQQTLSSIQSVPCTTAAPMSLGLAAMHHPHHPSPAAAQHTLTFPSPSVAAQTLHMSPPTGAETSTATMPPTFLSMGSPALTHPSPAPYIMSTEQHPHQQAHMTSPHFPSAITVPSSQQEPIPPRSPLTNPLLGGASTSTSSLAQRSGGHQWWPAAAEGGPSADQQAQR